MIEQRNRSRTAIVDSIVEETEKLSPNSIFIAQYGAMIDILLDIRDNARRSPKHYQVVWGASTADLSGKVTDEIKFGWVPVGGAVECEGAVGKVLIQTIVKYE